MDNIYTDSEFYVVPIQNTDTDHSDNELYVLALKSSNMSHADQHGSTRHIPFNHVSDQYDHELHDLQS